MCSPTDCVVQDFYITGIDAFVIIVSRGLPLGFGAIFCRGLNGFQDSFVQVSRSRGFVSLFYGGLDIGHVIGQCSFHGQRLAKEVLKRWLLAFLSGTYLFFSKCRRVVTVHLSQRGRYYYISRKSCSNCGAGRILGLDVRSYRWW